MKTLRNRPWWHALCAGANVRDGYRAVMTESAPYGDLDDSPTEIAGARCSNLCVQAGNLAERDELTEARLAEIRAEIVAITSDDQQAFYLGHLESYVAEGREARAAGGATSRP